MGWGSGLNNEGREVGYLVTATCDVKGCDVVIDRGLGWCCGGLDSIAFGGDNGRCGGYYCSAHGVDHPCGSEAEFFGEIVEEV